MMPMRLGLWGLLLGVLAGCGVMVPLSPGYEEPPADPCEAVSCETGTHCVDGDCVADDACAGVSCPPGRVCIEGECVHEARDDDGDGFPARSDCNDHDPDVVPGSQRKCQTDCGDGSEICEGPDWGACSAPVDCTCQPGDERPEPCGNCGEARRRCSARGVWEAQPGLCEGSGQCQPFAVLQEDCAHCGTRERLCDEECQWGDWGECVPSGVCSPREVEVTGCGPCGLGVGQRTCGDTCEWDPWSSCFADASICIPGMRLEEVCDDCSLASQTCTDECLWSDVSQCLPQSCWEAGTTETRVCLCGGTESRVCEDGGCYGPWSGCDTDNLLCPENGAVVPCAGGCATTTCTNYCFEACPVACHCQDNLGNVRCPGEEWTELDGCGPGVDVTMTCEDSGQGRCLVVQRCPADQL